MAEGTRAVLHCDMNNFYASVECMLDPSLKGHPVAVCGSKEERHGIVLAKNYPAKGAGVKTGETIGDALKKCPDLVVVPPHYEEYLKYSRLARAIYGRFTGQVEPYGMDECWLEVTGTEKLFGPPEQLADKLREIVREELGLTISVGVSFCKVFAKLGSDLKKPDATTSIPKDRFRQVIGDLPAEDLLGVGRSTRRVLDRYGIFTIGQLADADCRWLEGKLGKNGKTLWRFANGLDTSAVADIGFSSPIKSIGHGTTTMKDLTADCQIWLVLLELAQEVGHKLRLHQKRAHGVSVVIRDNTMGFRQWQTPLPVPTQSPFYLAECAYRLFRERYDWMLPVRAVTIRAIRLVDQDEPFQLDLSVDGEQLEKRERLESSVEEIRRRFGMNSVRNASLLSPLALPPEHAPVIMPTGLFA